MKIEKITVRAGRVVPHPLHNYGNVKSDLEIVATLEEGDDPEAVRRQLQAKCESDVEMHVAELKESIRDFQNYTTKATRIRRLETELADRQKELDAIKSEFEERPLLRPATT